MASGEVYITRRERFNAAHRLFLEEWSNEKNEEVFGKCSNELWHGHNYVLWVTLAGIPDEQTGFVMDLKQLSDILKSKVIDKLDHKNINLQVDFMKGIVPTTELLAKAIWEEIEEDINDHGARLHCVKISETENNFVEYYG